MLTRYAKLNTAHPDYDEAVTLAAAEFLVEYPNNLFSNNVAADGRNQSWAKILETTVIMAGVLLNTANRGTEHASRVVTDVQSSGWEPTI